MTSKSEADDATPDLQRPFIIWTWRRTGGTNLGTHLFEASPHRIAYQEPFNNEREFGYVVRNWKDGRDEARLRQEIDAILEQNVLIKHCVEMVPPEVSAMLAKAATERGYRHLFLVRRRSQNRLLSLHFAQSFDIWGKAHARGKDLAGIEAAIQNSEIPISRLVTQEKENRASLKLVYARLADLGVTPAVAVFEDLYNRFDSDVSRALLARITDYLGLPKNTDAAADKVLFSGEQTTKDKYKLYANYDAFTNAMGKLGEFSFEPSPSLRLQADAEFAAAVDVTLFEPRQSWRSDLVMISGVGTLRDGKACTWQVLCDGKPLETFNGLRSDNYAKAHANTPHAAAARFVAIDVPRGGVLSLSVTGDSGTFAAGFDLE